MCTLCAVFSAAARREFSGGSIEMAQKLRYSEGTLQSDRSLVMHDDEKQEYSTAHSRNRGSDCADHHRRDCLFLDARTPIDTSVLAAGSGFESQPCECCQQPNWRIQA